MSLKIITAIGSNSDFEKLISSFTVNSAKLNFKDFVKEWQAMKFYLIFSGREPVHELPVFVSELFQMATRFLEGGRPLPTRVAGVYILYSLYFLQPLPTKLKIRLTLADVKDLKDFLKQARTRNLEDAEYVLWKLVLSNAFHFCLFSSQFIFNKQAQADEEEVISSNFQSELIDVLCGDTLNELSALHSRYQEMKSAIAETTGPEFDASVMKTDFVQSVEKRLGDLRKNIEKSHGGKNASNPTEESQPEISDFRDTSGSEEDDIGARRRRLVARGMKRPAARKQKSVLKP